MPDFIEIVLIARDLASGNLSKAADKMEKDLAKAKGEAALTGSEFDRMGEKIDRSARGFDRPLKAIDDLVTKLPKATTKVGDFAQRVEHDMAKVGQQLDINFEQMAGFGEQLALNLEKAGTQFGHLGRQADGMKGSLRDASNAFRLLRSEIQSSEPHLNRMRVNFRAVESSAAALARAIGRTLKTALSDILAPMRRLGDAVEGRLNPAMRKSAPLMAGMAAGVSVLGASLAGGAQTAASFIGQIAGMAVPLGLATFGVVGLSGAVLALTGPVVGLTGALSTLSATAVALPAGLFAAAGAVGAFMGVIKPAIGGIQQYVAAQSKANLLGGPAAGAGGGATTTGGPSPQQQIAQAEQQLAAARKAAVQGVNQAEQNLQTTRRNAILSLMGLEQRLATLRASNAQKQKELEAAVADARAVQATELSGGDRTGQALAGAFVGEAQAQLQGFKTTAGGQEQQLQNQIARQRVTSAQSIRSAEQRVQQARLSGINAVAAAERNLQQQQQQAATQAASSLSREAQLYQNLTPLQKQVADNIIALKDRWHDMGVIVAARNSFLKEILKDIQAINRIMPQLARDTAGFANVITGAVGGARRLFVNQQGPTALGARVFGGQQAGALGAQGGFAGFTARAETQFIGAGTRQPTGLLAFISAVTRFTTSTAARGFLQFLTTTATDFGTMLLAAEKTSEATGGLQTFFTHAQSIATLLGHTARDAFVALKNLGSLAFPQGAGLLKSLADAARHFRTFTQAPQNAGRIKRFFNDGMEVVRTFGHLLGVLGKALTGLGGDAIKGGDKSPLARFFKALADVVPDLAKGIRDFVKNSGPAFMDLLKNLGPVVKNLGGGTGSSFGLFVGIISDFAGIVGTLTQNDTVAKITGDFLLLGYAFRGMLAPLVGVVVELIAMNLATDATAISASPAAAALYALGGAEWFALGPALLIIGALALMVVGIILLIKHWRTVAGFFGKVWDKVKDIFEAAWDWLKNLIVHHWKDILLFLLGPAGFAILIFKFRHELWDKIKDLASAAWDFITGLVPAAFHKIVDFLTNTAPDAVGRAFRAVWDKVKDITASVLVGVINTVNSFTNDIIHAINFVLKHIGAGSHTIGDIPKVTKADLESGILQLDEGGVVPGKKGDPVVAVVHAGETVLPTHKKPLASALGDIAGGITHGAGSILGDIGGVLGDLLDPLKKLIPDIPHVPGFVGEMVMDSLSYLKDKVLSWGKDKLESLFSGGSSNIGGNVDPKLLRGLILGHEIDAQNRFLGIEWGHLPASAALHPYPGGVPPWSRAMTADQVNKAANLALIVNKVLTNANLVALIGRAKQESGFQSGIINQNDSNWIAHIPSMGFLQTIDGTFRSHMMNPFTNIWDPLHNAVSAVRYMLANYHHIVGPSPTGYMGGGIIGQREGYLGDVVAANRSAGRPIRILAHIGEWVLNREQQARVAHAFGGLQNARQAIFQGTSVPSGGSYAMGGIIQNHSSNVHRIGGGVTQNFTINTTSPKIDIDYITRLAESRMAHLAEG